MGKTNLEAPSARGTGIMIFLVAFGCPAIYCSTISPTVTAFLNNKKIKIYI